MIQTIKTSGDDVGVVVKGNYSPSGHNTSRIVDKNGIAPTVMENHGTITACFDELRIRKLTPKECWRLMGFSDEDFEKASKVNSNSQLYKQAGNSIVVNVLEEIFKMLLGKDDY
jgi:DNA (cytosine-5)-methyltransferase 1